MKSLKLQFNPYEELLLKSLHIKYLKRDNKFRIKRGLLCNEEAYVSFQQVTPSSTEYCNQDQTISIAKKCGCITITSEEVKYVLTTSLEGISLSLTREVQNIGDVSFNIYFDFSQYGDEIFLSGYLLSASETGEIGIDGTMEGEIMRSAERISYKIGDQSKVVPSRESSFLNSLSIMILQCFSQYEDIKNFFVSCCVPLGEEIYREATSALHETLSERSETSHYYLGMCPLKNSND